MEDQDARALRIDDAAECASCGEPSVERLCESCFEERWSPTEKLAAVRLGEPVAA